jgi:uncharacterized protein YhfF
MSGAVIPPSVRDFWNAFTATLPKDPSDRFFEAFHFDDNAPAADGLAALVLAGKKRATAGLVWGYEGKPMPKPGALSIVTLFSGVPVCIIETLSIRIVPFSEVDAGFAAVEGEGDGSLAYWQAAHVAYFGRECQRIGREFSWNAPVLCEKFTVVYAGGSRAGF